MDELAKTFVNWMLIEGRRSSELHQAVTEAVVWIEMHPHATELEEDD